MRTATVIPISIQRMVCTGCGAEANASCNCGVAYQPKSIRAREAIEANPEKSDRAIAKEIGVDHKTVGKARADLETTGDYSPVERTGLDGKTRKMPERKASKNKAPLPGDKAADPGASAAERKAANTSERYEDRLCTALGEAEKVAKEIKKHGLNGGGACFLMFCLNSHIDAIKKVAAATERKYRKELRSFHEEVAAEKAKPQTGNDAVTDASAGPAPLEPCGPGGP